MTPLLRLAALVVAALTVSASAFAQSSLTLPSTDDVVPAGGSETIGTLPMGNLPLPAVCQACITVDFNDLAPEQVVAPNQYRTQGLRIEIGPSSTTSGVVEGSLTAVPCDGTRSLKTEPFIGPSFLLRFPDFPHGVTSVSLDAGDLGASDSDTITVKAFGDDALTTLVAFDIGVILQGAPTGCVRLSVQAESIKAVEITSDSVYVLSANSPSGVSSYPTASLWTTSPLNRPFDACGESCMGHRRTASLYESLYECLSVVTSDNGPNPTLVSSAAK